MKPILLRRGLLAGASMIVLGSLGYGRNSYAACVAGSPPNFTCSGANAAGQTVNYNDATVTTAPGFSVNTSGGPALSISGQGNVSFTDNNGSSLFSDAAGGSGLIISSLNGAPGSLSVVTNGQIVGLHGFGINASNDSSGGTLSITTGAGAIVGGEVGVDLYNGIQAINQGGSGSLSISVGTGGVYGSEDGIFAFNAGSGSATVETSGKVGGYNGRGIYVLNLGTSLSITTGEGGTYGYDLGIQAANLGSGSLSITTGSGNTFAYKFSAVLAYNTGTSLSVTTGSGSLNGGTYGIYAVNNGSGATTISTGSGYVYGYNGDGIFAYNNSNALGISVSTGTGDVVGLGNGIRSISYGQGDISITTGGGLVGGFFGDGIRALQYGTSGGIAITTNSSNVVGRFNGIYASNFGDGALNVTTGSGDVIGYSGTAPTG